MAHPQRVVSYNVGDDVEVIMNEDGFKGSYFAATVVSVLGDGRYEIEYDTLHEDEETNILLKEVVLAKDLRPDPPHVNARGVYKMFQSVDVFDNSGWWYGRINGRVDWPDAIGYYVYFSSSSEEVPYHCSAIRVHHDFVDGEWIRSS